GVYVISPEYKVVRHYQMSDDNNSLLSNTIRAIEQLDDLSVMVGTDKGINILNILNDSVNSPKTSTLPEKWIWSIYSDSGDNIWLGSFGGGIYKYNPATNKFYQGFSNSFKSPQEVLSFTETSDGKIFFITEKNGLHQILKDGSIKLIKLNIQTEIYQILTNQNDLLWLRTSDSKLYSFSIEANVLKEHKEWVKQANQNKENELILVEQNIWLIDQNGFLTSYNTERQSFARFKPQSDTSLTSLQVDNEKNIWVTSTKDQILKFNYTNNTFREQKTRLTDQYQISQTDKIIITKDWFWLGSSSQGVALINRKNSDINIFNVNNQLASNLINNILIDDAGTAWLTANNSISAVSPYNKKVKNYDKDFAFTDIDFKNLSALKSSQNTIFFGNAHGFTQFQPKEILTLKQKFNNLLFTNLLIANKSINVAQAKILRNNELKNKLNNNSVELFTLPEQINKIDTLKLKHQQSPFSLEFISPNAKFPSQVRYRYRLKGLETIWIESGKDNRQATYTNLSAGDYTFEVQAYDLHDSTLTKTRTLQIKILSPWWLSNAAIAFYTFLTLLLITYLLQQMRQKRISHIQIKLSEERLKLSLWGSGDEMWDWNITTGKIYRANIWGILEFPQDGKRNTGDEQTNIHPQDFPRVSDAITQHFESKTDYFESTYRVKDKEDKWVWVLDRGKIVERDENNKPTRMTGTLKDISQIKQAEGRLKLFAKCIENISDAVVIYDRKFKIVEINKAYETITGRNQKQMIGQPLTFHQYPDSFTQQVIKHLLTKGSWYGEIEARRANGNNYITDLNIDIIRDDDDNISHFVGVFSDITKRKENESELMKLANTDTLTGLPNRSYFQMNQARLVKNKASHALLVFDLDNFKKINDSLGHQVGDLLLCKVAERIVAVSRQQDTIYRLGGDEFSVIIENTNDIHTITTIAKNILRSIAQPMKLRNQEVVLYSSIGIVLYPEDGVTPHELLKNADTAMYHAKDLGGNKYQFFSDSMNKKAVNRLQVETLIRHGLKQDLFTVFYQPKIEIATGKVAGMEALVRFEHPTKGIISPIVFIPVSEETGQIIDIGEVVLRKSCHAAKKWVDSGLFDGRIAVNLSAVQFTQPNLVELIAEILQDSQLPAKYLELEITEGTVMDSPQKAIETMLQIRAMGIHLSLDDFGTGYSSLAYLKKFPLNTLKIDKAFVDDIEQSEQGRNMVATIVTIAHNLDLEVVAEGVETSQQLHFLAGLRCEQLQGYLYSKPLPEGQFHKYLISHQIARQIQL
ncbi:MAG: EAL domain-containing protein, partial [Alteromonadaceae bacterium]|nr:EAL domain-containing protein [Alteromonadaceae bacterium]